VKTRTSRPGLLHRECRKRWETVHVNGFYCLKALGLLTRPGTVAVDPDPDTPSVVFFLPAGATTDWPDVRGSELVRVMSDFAVPPAERHRPPGTYWFLPPPPGAASSSPTDRSCARYSPS
jgi:hypothetical protein